MYNLLVSNNFQEKQFIKSYGQELFDKLADDAYVRDGCRCVACGHQPSERNKLYLHIPTTEINKKHPELSQGVTLCKMCHTTQHIEVAIKKKWVIFVNSTFDQNNIIRLNRGNQIHGAILQRAIVALKTTPEQFLKEWYAGEAKFTPTLKVIFTNNFTIDDL